MTNHYRTLGIDPDADGATIRGAYVERMRRFHPDRHGGEADRQKAQDVTAAYEVLRDPERRAAYDRARVLSFAGTAAAPPPSRVRGGPLGRNLFLLVAAGTAGLGYWALQQPLPAPRGHSVQARAEPVEPAADVRFAPIEVEAADPLLRVESPLPIARERVETPLEGSIILPPLPVVRPAPGAASAPAPRADPARRMPVSPVPSRSEGPVPTTPTIDLAGLEHHLQLLTDQSVRYGNAAKRARLFSTRDQFVAKLSACATDLCRRDAYLRRNQEIAEIMRN
ncbi:J domain-containing protein [Sphingomonas astaxanthinifaciens]|uniref:J domain-containing protein n=1 Tax=Sphingomonas astaxanthinifaciens DSM 22298 TaxID=1123267 RepID=A0ABQ5Z940_9SPHN|nr:J domain-containing protein [Sphingomonas astaxanthinifaciens]GLR48132.1 hypothetical protein GCM10007925_18450 [Sphingomonas astaxanthinifaciens DSM 22298]